MRLREFILDLIGSRLMLGIVMVGAAALWWFGFFFVLETVLGLDPKGVFLLSMLIRGTVALLLGVWGCVLIASALTD